MRRVALSLVFVIAARLLAFGGLQPMTVKDVSLMLRSGYSAAAVEKEIAARHFNESIDAAAEKALAQSGATAALISALKSGAFAVPAHELAAVLQEAEAKARRRAQQADESKKLSTLYQDQLARSRVAAPTTAAPSDHAVAAMVKGDLVTSRNGVLNTFNDQALERKKLVALYFSARWCPACRKFTPELVEYYNRISAAHPEFEIIFVSSDRSGSAMEEYMKTTQMPWPAVTYDKIAEKEVLARYAGPGIPCLVVLDMQGKVISDSYDGKTYRGPSKVLADLDQLFSTGSVGPVAQSR